MANGDDELAKYAAKQGGGEEDELSKYEAKAAPVGRTETMSAQPSLMERVGKLAAPGPGKMPIGAPGPGPAFENYTPEGRAEHPVLSRIGDITRGIKQYGKMVGALAPLIPETEALQALRRPGMPAALEEIPTVEATATNRPAPREPLPPPAVRTQYRTEIPGTVQDPSRLGPRGAGGVVVPERKLLPAPAGPLEPIGRPPAAKPEPFTTTEKMGIRWAKTPGLPDISIPSKMTPEEIPDYVAEKQALQRQGVPSLQPIGSREGVVPKPALQPIGAPKPTVEGVVNQAMGVKPLERNVPIREQLKPIPQEAPTAPPAETDPVKIKYPDPAVRKFVRANGEALVDAVGDDKELLQKIHDLKNVDVREAAVNAGIDVGTKHVGSKGQLGPEQISRQEVLTKLLQQGIKPNQILELAKPKPKPKGE